MGKHRRRSTGGVTAEPRDAGNSGVVGATHEAQVLHRLDTLLNDLLASVGRLPPDQAGQVAGETIRLKSELVKPARDRDLGRIRVLLSSLTRAVAAVAPLAEIVTDIADLIGKLPRSWESAEPAAP